VKKLLFYITVLLCVLQSQLALAQAPPWQWARDSRSNNTEAAFDAAVNPSTGDVFITGLYSGGLNGAAAFNSATFTATNGSTDIYIAKYNSTGTFQWAIEIGGTGADGGRSIALDAAGNIYITGYFNGTVDFDPSAGVFNITSTAGQDAFIAKYSPAGAFLWAARGGGASTDIGYGIYADANGVYITGAYVASAVFRSSGTSTVTASTAATPVNNNVFVAKYDQNGIVQWVASAGSNSAEEGFDVTADANRVYVVGDYRNALSIYNSAGALQAVTLPIQSSPNTDIFVIAYTQAGGFSWATNASAAGNDQGRGITSDGTDIYIAGGISNNANFPNPAPVVTQTVVGGIDAFAAKLDGTTGTYQWVRHIRGTGAVNDVVNSIVYHPLGRVYLAGYYNGSLNFTIAGGPILTAVNSTDLFVASFTSNNAFYYALSGGGTGVDNAYGLGLNNVADVYIGGHYTTGPSAFGTTTLATATNSNIAVAKCGCGVVLSLASAGSDQTVCATTATMAGNTPTAGTGTWSLLSGSGSITSPTSPNTTITGLGMGNNQFIWTIGGSGCPVERDTVTIRRELTPSIATAGPSQSVCAVNTVMAANTPTTGTGAWTLLSGTGTIGTPSSASSAITSLGIGVSVYQWAISYLTCPVTTSTMSITRYAPPTTANAGPNQTICSATVTMAANTTSAGIGTWSLLSGSGTITNANLNNTTVTGLGVGANVFQWTTSNGTCPTSVSTVTITRDASPTTANAGSTQTVCATTATLAGNTPAVGTGSWTLVSGSLGITTPTSPTSGLTGVNTGTHVLQWSITNGVCPASTSTVAVIRDNFPTVASAGASQTICASTYTMSGNTPAIGTGSWTVVSGSGAILTPTLAATTVTNMGVGNNVFQWTISNGVCPASTSTMSVFRYDFPTTSVAGPSQSVCATTATMAANTPAVGTGSWTLLGGSGTIVTPTSPTSQITGLGIGTNSFRWTISNGVCPPSASTVAIVRYAPPSVANAGASQTVCANTATMAANTTTAGSGLWTLVSGAGTITTPSAANTGITGLGVGNNVFQWTTSNGVCASSSATTSVYRYDFPTTSVAGPSQSVCATTATLAGNIPAVGTGSWTLVSGAGTITSPTSPSSGLTALGVGTNIFQWTISNGTCPPSTSTVAIVRYAPPSISVAGPSQTVCATTATMSANTTTAGSGLWTLLSGAGAITTPAAANTGITALGVGNNIFQWTTSNGVCASSSSTVSIWRDDIPTVANAGTAQSICGNTVALAGNTPTVGTGLWTLISGAGTITSPSSPNSSVTGLALGNNVFQWTISNGSCPASSATVSITSYTNPTTANAGISQTICVTTATLNGNAPAIGTGSWTLVSGSGTIASPTSPNSALSGLAVGTNVFQWSISNGVCPASTSTVAINVDANPTVANAGLAQTICTTTAVMAGNTPAIGTGSWSVVSGSGTFANASLPTTGVSAISVGINIYQWTISNGVCPATSATVAINRDNYPTIANAGVSQTVCATTATLNGNVPTVGTGVWTVLTGTSSITSPGSATTGVTGLSVGSNVYQWTISNGVCPASTSTVSVHRDDFPTIANAGTTITVCNSFTATMAANTPTVGTGLWSVVSGSGVFTNPNSPTTLVNFLSVGTNIFQWTISNGSCPPSTSTVAVIRNPPPSVANAGTSQTLCVGNATLSGNTPAVGTGVWSLVSGSGTIISPSTPSTGVTGLGVGTNIFQWTINMPGCTPSTSTVAIVRDPLPSVSVAGPTQTLCSVSTTTMAANTPVVGNGLWSLISGSGLVATPGSPTSVVNFLSVGTNVFQWTISNGTCPPSTSTVAIIRDPPPTISTAGSNQTLCATSATLNGNAPTVGTGVWTLISGAGTITAPTSPNSSVTGLGFGVNVFQWSISNSVCAPSTSTVAIVRDTPPTVSNAGVSQTVCVTSATLTGNAPTVGSGLWTLVSGSGIISSPSSATTAVNFISAGTNVFQWTISNGTCPSSSSTVAIVRDQNPTIANAGTSQTLCSSSATLSGNTPGIGSGAWTVISGPGSISSPLSAVTPVTSLGIGLNVFQWTISNGVCPPSISTVAINVDANPTVANAGVTQTLCAATATLNGNTPAIGTGNWSVLSGTSTVASPSSPTSSVTGLSFGSNLFQWTISNGTCPPSSSTVSIVRDIPPTISNAGISQTICAANATLTANTPIVGTGLWIQLAGTGALSTFTNPVTSVSGISVGTEIYQWIISNGVCPSSSSTVAIVRDPAPTIANAGLTQTVCTATATLAGNTPVVGTGNWTVLSGGATVTNPSLPNSGVTNLGFGANVFQWMISNGTCPPSTATVTIFRDIPPTVSNAGLSQTVCVNPGTAILTANTPVTGTGIWTVLSGTSSVATPTSASTGVSGLSTGLNVYQWSISNGVCPVSTSTVGVYADPLPTPSAAGPSQTICVTTASTTLAGNTPATGIGTWSILSGGGTITSPNSPNSTITGLNTPGVTILQWSISNGTCPPSITTTTITVNNVPPASVAGTSQTVCVSPGTATLSANTPSVGFGTWSVLSGGGVVTSPNSPNSAVTGLTTGTTVLQWSISYGVCANTTSTMSIVVNALPTISNAGTTQTLCASTTTLVANTPGIGNGVWSLVAGTGVIATPTNAVTGISGMGVGTNDFQWTITNGVCPPSTSTISVIVYTIATTAIAGPSQTVCSSSAIITANTPTVGTGLWSVISGTGTIISTGNPTTTVNGLSFGSNIFQWAISNGVCPVTTSTLQVYRDIPPTAATVSTSQTVCATTATMSGNIPTVGTGLWSLVSGSGTITAPGSAVTSVTALGVGTNIFQWTISNGVCPAETATLSITRDDFPTIANAGVNTTVCATSTVLAGNTPTVGTGLWTVLAGSSTVQTISSPTSSVVGLSVGINTYQWTISNGVCPATSSTVNIVRDAFPSISVAGPNQTLCASSTATMAANTPTAGTGFWSIVSGTASISSFNSPTTTVTGLVPGVEVLQWTISNGVCPPTVSTVTINVDPIPSIAVAGPTTTICSSTTTLAANTPTSGVGTWSVISGGGSVTSVNSPTSTATGLLPGIHVLQWTISSGVCVPSISTTTIQVDANPTVSNAGLSQTICVSAPNATMNANAPTIGTGLWSFVSGSGSISNFFSPTTPITGLSLGLNTLQWTISNGVCLPSSSTVNVQVDNVPTVANAGLSQTVCVSNSVTTLAANTPVVGIGTWSLVSGTGTITAINSPSSTFSFTAPGIKVLQWTIANGVCANSISTMTIQVDNVPTVSNAGSSQTVCVSTGSTVLNANIPSVGTGLWNIISGSGVVVTPNNVNSNLIGLTTGTTILQWTISNGVCASSTSTTSVQVDAMPTVANAGLSQTVCVSNSVTTLAANAPVVGVGTWSLVSGTGTIAAVNSPSSTYSFTSPGINVLQWSIANGVCATSISTTTIQVDNVPTVSNAGPSQTICASTGSTVLNANIPAVGNGLWNIVSGSGTVVTPNNANSNLTGLTTGTTIVQWTISNGVCASSTSTTSVQVDAMPTVANAGVSQTVCVSNSVTTLAANVPLVGVGTWSLIAGSGTITAINSPSSTFSFTAPGIKVLQWGISNGVCATSVSTMTIQVDNVPATSIAGPSQTVCVSSSVTTLAANTPSVGVGTWSLVSGTGTITSTGSPTSPFNFISPGTNVLQWSISNGVCANSTSTMSVQVDNIPTVSNAGASQTICVSTGSTTLAANTPVTGIGTWSIVSGSGVVTSINSPTTTVTGLTVGTTVLQWIISNGVCANSTSTMSIQVDGVPTTPIAGSAGVVCVSTGSANLIGNVPTVGVGTWSVLSGGGVITSSTSAVTTITALTVGNTVVQWSITNGSCGALTTTLNIQVDNVPTISSAGTSQTLCLSSNSTTLSGNTPTVGVGTWSVIAGGGSVSSVNSPTSAVTSLPIGVNVLQWSIANGVCPSSISTTTIQVDDVPATSLAGVSQTICVSAGSATLAANTPSVGVGTWSIVSGSGTIVAVNNPSSSINGLAVGTTVLQWSISNGVCANSTSTMSIQVDDMPTNSVAGPSQTICINPGSTILAGNTPGVGVGTWSVITGTGTVAAVNNPGSSISGLSVGNNIIQWTISNGVCAVSSSTMNVKVDDLPTPANAGSDIIICSPNSTISATPLTIGTGSWTVISGAGVVTNSLLASTSATNLVVGTNLLQWTTTNGVCPPSIDTLQIDVLINLLPIVAGPDQFVCTLTPTLNATPHAVGTGTWIPLGGAPAVTTPTLANSTFTVPGQGTYTYVWSVGYLTCPVENDTVQITTYLNPSISNAGLDQAICALTTSLTGNTPAIGTGTWVQVGASPSVSNPTSTITSVSFTNTGTYTYVWSIGNGTCPVENDTVVVFAYAPPSAANAGPDQSICSYSTNLAAISPSIGVGVWSPLSTTNSTVTLVGNPGSEANVNNQGLFGFVWTVTNSSVCPSTSDTMFVQAYTPILPGSANAGPDITSDLLNNLMAGNTPTVGAGTWSILTGPGGSFANTGDPLSNFTANEAGTYELVWTLTNGVCAAVSDTMILIINPLLIPQVITPNGDGSNDFFEVRGLADVNDVKLFVFNRWGNQVYHHENYKDSFKGENNDGVKLADDTYYFIIEAQGKKYTGYLVIKSN